MTLAACLASGNVDHITPNARKSPLHLRMANLRRMMDKMVPRHDTEHVEVKKCDKKRFYDFIRNNRIPVAIRGTWMEGKGWIGEWEAVLIEENKGNNIRNYTNENTSGYYVLEVMKGYNDLRRWIELTLDYYHSWTIGNKSFGYALE